MGLRFGVIGLGRMGYYHTVNISRHLRDAELVAVCDLSEARARDVAKELSVGSWYTNYNEMLKQEQLDAILITNTAAAHCQTIEDACRAKVHIFCEKPTGIAAEELDRIDKAIAQNPGKVFQVGFARRFDPSYRLAKEKVERGEIGKIIKIQSVNRDPAFLRADYARFGPGSGGMFFDQLVHDIDLIRWITGAEVESAYTLGGIYAFDEFRAFDDIDNTVVSLSMSNGVMAIIEGSKNSTAGFHVWMEIMGTEGCLKIGPCGTGTLEICDSHGIRKEINQWVFDRFEDAYINELQMFIQAVLNGTTEEVGAADARASVEVAEMCKASYEEKRIVYRGEN
mgnify:CR=1 FL=1